MPTTQTNEPGTVIYVDTAAYLSLKPKHIKDRLSIGLTDHSYKPRVDDLESDWVAHVSAPAFKIFRQRRGGGKVESFCSVGTGSGLDVLSAAEVLGVERVGLTDVHLDVVDVAAKNIARNLKPGYKLAIEAGFGDLLEPLRKFGSRYTVIYENLPNVPLADPQGLAVERTSSTYVPPRAETLPELVKRQMLDLHYLALVQARDFLAPGGALLSCMGARVPLSVYLSLGELAGYRSSFLTYSWKVQGDPEEVIRDHAGNQKKGFGPFYFYRAEVLKKVFASVDLAESGQRALEIEAELLPHRLDSETAYEAFRGGEKIGHTVAMLQSEL